MSAKDVVHEMFEIDTSAPWHEDVPKMAALVERYGDERAAQERAAIVSWLEKEAKAGPYRHATYGDSCPCCVREQTLEDFAEAIRAGEHERGGGK